MANKALQEFEAQLKCGVQKAMFKEFSDKLSAFLERERDYFAYEVTNVPSTPLADKQVLDKWSKREKWQSVKRFLERCSGKQQWTKETFKQFLLECELRHTNSFRTALQGAPQYNWVPIEGRSLVAEVRTSRCIKLYKPCQCLNFRFQVLGFKFIQPVMLRGRPVPLISVIHQITPQLRAMIM